MDKPETKKAEEEMERLMDYLPEMGATTEQLLKLVLERMFLHGEMYAASNLARHLTTKDGSP